ncbi:MAG: Exosome complex component RRP41, partial [Marteilia pararefringens]
MTESEICRSDGRLWNEQRQVNCLIGSDQSATTRCSVTNLSELIRIEYRQGNAVLHGLLSTCSKNDSDSKKPITVQIDYSQLSSMRKLEQSGHPKINHYKSSEMAINISNIFEKVIQPTLVYSIKVRLIILQSDGSDLSCCINACSLILVAANVPIKHLIASSSIGYVYQFDQSINNEESVEAEESISCFFVDLNDTEQNKLSLPSFELAIICSDPVQIVILEINGRIHDSLIKKMTNLGID